MNRAELFKRVEAVKRENAEKETKSDKAVEAKEKILSVVRALVEKVKANTVLYNLIKKLDIWKDIEKLVGGD